MNIKNLIIKTVTILLVSITILMSMSCTDNLLETVGETGVLTISICESVPKALTLTPSAPAASDINWSYTLYKTNGTNGIGQVSNETLIAGSAVTKSVSIGTWTAEVWGYRDAECKELVYHGTGSGDISRSGGTIAVTATTITDATQAHALTPGDTPKATADLILKPVDVEGDDDGTNRNSLEWVVDVTVVSTWLWQAGTWTCDGAPVNEAGVVVTVEPGEASITAIVKNAEGDIIAAEGWKTQPFAINCTYSIEGMLRSDLTGTGSAQEV